VPHYRNAPITEAIIDLRARSSSGATSSALRQLVAAADQEQFPEAMELMKTTVQVHAGEEPSPSSSHEGVGWILRSADRKRTMQARRDGFAFARHAPYEEWETFSGEARSQWAKYREITTPEAVTRLSLKYVNRFDIPLPIRDFKDFFLTIPEVSPGMPQGLAGFFMQLQIPYPELQSMLVLTQTLVPPPQAGLVSVVLDIEMVCANNVPSDDEAIWKLLNQLRQKKNEIFEACITDAARELIL